eukprot:3230297-Rhodomonas_salina.1
MHKRPQRHLQSTTPSPHPPSVPPAGCVCVYVCGVRVCDPISVPCAPYKERIAHPEEGGGVDGATKAVWRYNGGVLLRQWRCGATMAACTWLSNR